MSKRLVAFFSASGVTAQAAKTLVEAAGAGLYEIRPQTHYTSEDLNWRDKDSRCSREMNDRSFRPPLADRDAPVADCDTIFLGFPIWWSTAPTIILTFLESYDFSGKTIVLFATSGGSGLDRSAVDLKDSVKGAALQAGRLLNGKPSKEELAAWVDSL